MIGTLDDALQGTVGVVNVDHIVVKRHRHRDAAVRGEIPTPGEIAEGLFIELHPAELGKFVLLAKMGKLLPGRVKRLEIGRLDLLAVLARLYRTRDHNTIVVRAADEDQLKAIRLRQRERIRRRAVRPDLIDSTGENP